MIEFRQIRPGFRGVAGFAAFRLAVRAALCHVPLELIAVRIGMAAPARTILESVRNNFGGVPGLACGVALRAVNSHMRAGKRETTLLVFRDRKGRRLEAVNGMARFALSLIGRSSKLPVVDILVAVEAFRESNLVLRRSAGRNVALRALHGRVLPEQRIRGCCMSFHIEE